MISRRRGPQAGFSSEKSVLKNPDSGYVENQTKSTGTIYFRNRLLRVGKKVVNENITRGGRTTMKTELDTRALLNVKEMCEYLGIGQTKARELLSNPANGFTVRIGNRLYAHKGRLDHWLLNQILS